MMNNIICIDPSLNTDSDKKFVKKEDINYQKLFVKPKKIEDPSKKSPSRDKDSGFLRNLSRLL